MFIMEKEKEKEIKKMVSILKSIDLEDIQLLARDANTLLMRQQQVNKNEQELKTG